MAHFLSHSRNPRLKSLLGILFASFVMLAVSWIYAAGPFTLDISGTFGNSYTSGSFAPGKNAGLITFSGIILDSTDAANPTLNGEYIFLQTVGWAKLTTATDTLDSDPKIPLLWTSGPRPLHGYAWSDNAGWIVLDSLEPSTYSGVAYVPGTQKFLGYAWSDTLGYIDFSTADPVFKNKVKVLGNIWGNKVFDTDYYVWSKFDTISMTSFLDTIRKNIATMTRGLLDGDLRINITPNNINPVKLNNDTLFYSGHTLENTWTLMDENSARSLIVEWGDVYISGDIPRNITLGPRAIIVMKDTNGHGGNIYIKSSVKNIYTSLIAEGTIYSGEDLGNLSNSLNLPKNQLYIVWSVISRNTIGWTANNSCPYTEWACTPENATKYDLNYFRSYDQSDQFAYWSDNHNFEDFSVIIEYDSRILADPPPWLSSE